MSNKYEFDNVDEEQQIMRAFRNGNNDLDGF
jgi:hypothetical protein